MADDRYNWLDKDAAEQLLRGEPVIGPDSVGARELRQLLDAAAAAGGGAARTGELPGEDAALAAFRQARNGSAVRRRKPVAGEQPVAAHTLRADLPERTRLARPFRRGFAVALAACAIGGVAVAAGTGMLPTPFEGGGDPDPAASVSAAETPGTLATQEPGPQTEGTTERTPDATPGQGTTPPGGSPTPGGDNDGAATGTPGDGPGPEDTAGAGDNGDTPPDRDARQRYVERLCRAYESGGHGGLDRRTIRRLERAAGGADKVHAFCRKYLGSHQDGDSGGGGEDGYGGGKGGSQSGSGSGQGGGDEDDDEHPPAAPSTTPAPGASTPAPAPSGSAPDPVGATLTTALSGRL